MFERELEFFISHQDDLVREHPGKTVVLRGEHIEGVFDTPLAAYVYARQHFEPGTFMIQRCESGPSAYTVHVNSLITRT